MTETINVSEAKQDWRRLVDEVVRGRRRVLMERDGVPVAAIVSTQDLERLRQLDAQRERDLAILDASQAAFNEVPEDELEREIAKALAELRAENRAREQRNAESG